MGPSGKTHARNIAIIVVLAVIVWRVQAGREGAEAISNVLGVLFLGGFAFLGYRLYMEHRTTIRDLDEQLRRILYGSLALAAFCIVATRRMWDAGGASVLLWLALISAAGYGVFHVVQRYRAYD
jgi:hypothetical protein